MLRETQIVEELHADRYRGEDPKYALVISHGIASHGGIYDVFCTHHAARGADIWSYDAPSLKCAPDLGGSKASRKPSPSWDGPPAWMRTLCPPNLFSVIDELCSPLAH